MNSLCILFLFYRGGDLLSLINEFNGRFCPFPGCLQLPKTVMPELGASGGGKAGEQDTNG